MMSAFISLGSNLGDPVRRLDWAVGEIDRLAGVRIERCSKKYKSEPLGCVKSSPWFYNMVIRVGCEDPSPANLLCSLQEIEKRGGRLRSERFERKKGQSLPRTIDLDILLFHTIVSEDPRLMLPHPKMHERAFVLLPLLEITDDDFHLPGGVKVRHLLSRLDFLYKNGIIFQNQQEEVC